MKPPIFPFVPLVFALFMVACSDGQSNDESDAGGTQDEEQGGPDAGHPEDSGTIELETDGGTEFGVRAFVDEDSWQPSGDLIARDISGYEPVENGSYPVFIWVEGTGVHYWDFNGVVFAEEMAKRGFVAASVAYDNVQYTLDCNQLDQKTKGVFDESDTGSAIHPICGRDKADCNRGIVVAGWSQGAHLAMRAMNFNSLVKAALPLGNGVSAYPGHDLTACLGIANTTIESTQVRSLVGASDEFFGCNPNGDGCQRLGIRAQQEETTGQSCGDEAMHCINDDGSGWYIVQTHETAWGGDNHGFWLSFVTGGFDPVFLDGDEWWSLNPSLDWLSNHVIIP